MNTKLVDSLAQVILSLSQEVNVKNFKKNKPTSFEDIEAFLILIPRLKLVL